MWEPGTQLQAAVQDCTAAAVWARSDAELIEALRASHAAVQQLTGHCAELVRELEGRGVPATQHAINTAVWLRDLLGISAQAGKRLIGLGRHLYTHPGLAQAVTDRQVGVEQATVIGEVLDGLPDDLDAPALAKAETMLVDWAGQFDPKALRDLGRRILAHVDPAAADHADARALARDTEQAHRQRSLTLSPHGQGRTRITGWVDAEAAATITAALDPLCRPTPDDERTAGQRRADALAEVCRLALHTETLPDNGGDRPHVALTVDYDLLRGQLGAGQLDSGETLTAEQVRRLACDAHLLPAVLGGQGQILDLGRTRRLIAGGLRRALILRDGGCAFPACDRPATWCDGHHVVHWADGGPTTLDNSVLVCGAHHRLIHHGGWTVRIAADRLPEFLPPAHLDPSRTPRRNVYHRPHRAVLHPRI